MSRTERRPRRSIASRVLASFAILALAFAVTLGWSVVALQQSARDSEEIARGYVPVALRLGQLQATQGTISTLVDGIPDERNPASTKLVLQTLVSARRGKFVETRRAISTGLGASDSPGARQLADELESALSKTEDALGVDSALLDRLFGAIDRGDRPQINAQVVALGAVEHDAASRVRTLSDRVAHAMDDVSADARNRQRRALYALVGLAVLTFVVGVIVSVVTRRLLSPIADMRKRARDVEQGDMSPREVVPTGDEIGELSLAFERMIAAVAAAQEQAVTNERLAAVGKMAAHVTHEIRNPLSSIGLNLELLQEEIAQSGADEQRNLVRAIAREVGRLESLSEEYLRLARLPSPRLDADDLPGMLREVVDFAKPEMSRDAISLELELPAELPPTLFDESQIKQALSNLLRNAREAMEDGGQIVVRARAEGMSVVIDVEDDGPGIPESIREEVFDPFFSTKDEGTGLGLAITRQIVAGHGGMIRCEDVSPHGTVFHISLPFAPTRVAGPLRESEREQPALRSG